MISPETEDQSSGTGFDPRGIQMNCIVRMALKATVGVLAITAATGASAQVTFARGDLVWSQTAMQTGFGACTSCHNGVGAPSLATLRQNFLLLNQTETRARLDLAIAGVGAMAGYAGMLDDDKNSVAVFLANIIGIPSLAASPTALTALTATVGSAASTTLTLTNSGKATLTVSALARSGANSGEFSHMQIGNGCISQMVLVGGNCRETITFTPGAGASGTRTATLTITHNGSPTTTVLALSGTVGTAPGGVGIPGGGGGGGAVWPVALLLLAAAALRRRRLHQPLSQEKFAA